MTEKEKTETLPATTPETWLKPADEAEAEALAAMPVDTGYAAAVAQATAEVQCAYTIAHARPRDMITVRNKALELCKNKAFAEMSRYLRPVGGGHKAAGWSIRAAEEFVRIYQHIRVSVTVSFENDTVRRIKVTVIDLETNSAFSKEATLKKTIERYNTEGCEIVGTRTTSAGKVISIIRASDEEMVQKENAAVAKLIRNEALRLIPADLLDECEKAVAATNKGANSNGAKEQAVKVLDTFYGMGIERQAIEAYMGCDVAQFTEDDLEELRLIYIGISKEGKRWSEYTELKDRNKGSEVKPEILEGPPDDIDTAGQEKLPLD